MDKHMEMAGDGQTMVELVLIVALISIAALLVLSYLDNCIANLDV